MPPESCTYFTLRRVLAYSTDELASAECLKHGVPPAPRLILLESILVRDLEPPGELQSTRSYSFEFNNVEMPYESYNGVNVRLRRAARRDSTSSPQLPQ